MLFLLVCACSVTCVSWIVYKLLIEPFTSPLRKIPGAKYNPFYGNMREIMRGQTMEASSKFIEQFGPVYRYYFFFGRERIAVADPAVMKHVLSTNIKNYKKPQFGLLKTILGDGLLLSEGEIHASQKRLISPAFNQASITGMIPTFQSRVDSLVSYWKEAVDNPDNPTNEVDVFQDVSKMTLDVIGATAFGYEFNAIRNPDSAVAKAFNTIIYGGGSRLNVMIPYLNKLPTEGMKVFNKHLDLIKKTVDTVIEEKQNLLRHPHDSHPMNDILSVMLKAKEENRATNLNLRDQVLTLMAAGYETVSTAMTWILYAMTSYPEIQQKCYNEIMSVFGEETEVTWERIDSLSYCNNVIKETLRLYPPVPVMHRQNIKDDVLQDKFFIPKNTQLILMIGAMMRRPELFEDPLTFNPNRFDDEDVSRDFYKFLPFLIGPRMCVGSKFAMAELATMMVGLFRNFTFEKVPGHECKMRLWVTMRPDPPLRVRLGSRDQ